MEIIFGPFSIRKTEAGDVLFVEKMCKSPLICFVLEMPVEPDNPTINKIDTFPCEFSLIGSFRCIFSRFGTPPFT
jgi:hypothetical protein